MSTTEKIDSSCHDKVIDMHIHSNYSDGLCSPETIFQYAKEADLKAISITDHNTIRAFPEAYQESMKTHIEFIPGVELHTLERRKVTHILGYYMDTQNNSFETMLKKANNISNGNAKVFIGTLQKAQTLFLL